jgi:hypothetical protein
MSTPTYVGRDGEFYRYDFVEDDGTVSGWVLSNQAPEDN